MSEGDSYVQVLRHGHVAELRLCRVGARNALSTAMAERLIEAAGEVRASRAVVLSSAAPGAFCVGADLKERNGLTDAGFLAQREVFRAAFAAIREMPVPVVAAVHGFAVVGLPEVTRGIVPGGGGTQLLPRRAGAGVATELILTGRHVAAEEAARLRLVDRLVGEGEDGQAAREVAAQIAANSPVAVRNARNAVRRALDVGLGAGLDIEDAAWRAAVFSDDRREGVRAFIEHREPRWP
jgi:enoyl-CoA hydratase/carnithine racemase